MSKIDQTIVLHDGRKLGYAEYGDPKGEPLLFLHGWPGSRIQGSSLHKAGTISDIRIICPERPGYGLSDYKKERRILDFADDIVEFTNILGIKKFFLIGISGGAPYAFACAYKIPKRIIRVGIVCGLAPVYIPELRKGMRFINKLLWESISYIPFLGELACIPQLLEVNYFPQLAYLYRLKEDLAATASVREEIKLLKKESFRQGIKGPAYDPRLFAKDWGFDISGIKKEVFLWYGSLDNIVPIIMGKYYSSHLQNNKLLIYPNEGHALIVKHANEILKTLTT